MSFTSGVFQILFAPAVFFSGKAQLCTQIESWTYRGWKAKYEVDDIENA